MAPVIRITLLVSISIALIFLTACQPQVTQSIESVSLGDMKKLYRVGSVYLGSQPDSEDLQLFQERGVRTVINLRHDSELNGFDEKVAVEELGMLYVHIPFNGEGELTDSVLEQGIQALDVLEAPALLHCASSNRVGAVWLAYRVKANGLDYETALEEARTAGLRSAAYIKRVQQFLQAN